MASPELTNFNPQSVNIRDNRYENKKSGSNILACTLGTVLGVLSGGYIARRRMNLNDVLKKDKFELSKSAQKKLPAEKQTIIVDINKAIAEIKNYNKTAQRIVERSLKGQDNISVEDLLHGKTPDDFKAMVNGMTNDLSMSKNQLKQYIALEAGDATAKKNIIDPIEANITQLKQEGALINDKRAQITTLLEKLQERKTKLEGSLNNANDNQNQNIRPKIKLVEEGISELERANREHEQAIFTIAEKINGLQSQIDALNNPEQMRQFVSQRIKGLKEVISQTEERIKNLQGMINLTTTAKDGKIGKESLISYFKSMIITEKFEVISSGLEKLGDNCPKKFSGKNAIIGGLLGAVTTFIVCRLVKGKSKNSPD